MNTLIFRMGKMYFHFFINDVSLSHRAAANFLKYCNRTLFRPQTSKKWSSDVFF